MATKKVCIAHLKFWFGQEQDIFRNDLIIERHDQHVYVYKKDLKAENQVLDKSAAELRADLKSLMVEAF
jgi:hypothetical protein